MFRNINDPFGALLKQFRKRQRLTQQQLAEAMGVHRNTVGRWEDGSFLPESKAFVLELVKHLHLKEQEAHMLLDASMTAPATIWSVPYPRNPFFIGREETLEALHTYLDPGQKMAPTPSYALYGLGGVGKTQLALEYVYRYALEYGATFWISAETIEQIHASFLRIAERLNLPECTANDQQQIVAAVQRWLETRGEWLLIWDNLEDLALLQHFLPSSRQGTILITTRSQTFGTLAYGIYLAPLEGEEAMHCLLCRAKMLKPEASHETVHRLAVDMPGEYAAAHSLITFLGGLPLALDQAGAYIEETGCGVSGYLYRYEKQQVRLLDRRGSIGSDHPQSVTATFGLAIERAEREKRAAAELLRMCAFLHAEAIPEELFEAGAAYLGPELSSLGTDPFLFDQAITILRNLSLLQRQPQTRTLSIHRLMQDVLRERMSKEEQTLWQERTVKALNAVFPEATQDTGKQRKRLIPHILACLSFLTDQIEDQALVELLYKAADYLRDGALYDQAIALYQQALDIGERLPEAEQLVLVPVLSGLARLLGDQSHYEQAEPLYQRALRIGEQAKGAEDDILTLPLSGLARLYKDQGEYGQAEALYQRVLFIREQTWGAEHPFVARTLNHLASLSKARGNYKQAELLLGRVLSIQEQTLESKHPDIATSLNSLAVVHWNQGKYEQAEAFYLRALHIQEQAWGPEHPLVGVSLNNLAVVYAGQEKYEQAEAFFQRALHIQEQTWGSEHPQVATSLNNLGELCLLQGKYEQSEVYFQRALQIGKRVWGPEHPDRAMLLSALAELYLRQGKYEQAEPLFQQALQIWEQTGGPSHPEIATSLNGLASLYMNQGNVEQAALLLERALHIREEHLGQQHSGTAQTLYDLALCRQKQNKLSEARSLAKRSLEIRVQRFGETHPKTVAASTLYAELVQA